MVLKNSSFWSKEKGALELDSVNGLMEFPKVDILLSRSSILEYFRNQTKGGGVYRNVETSLESEL